jgi:hypothetical protein
MCFFVKRENQGSRIWISSAVWWAHVLGSHFGLADHCEGVAAMGSSVQTSFIFRFEMGDESKIMK